MADAERDTNNIPTLLGVSSTDGTTPTLVYVDPTTHRLKTDGITGYTGYTGPNSGFTGYTGYTGRTGYTGYTGPGVGTTLTLTAYASDALAGTGGLTTGKLYQTSGTGTGVFATAGVVMIKQ